MRTPKKTKPSKSVTESQPKGRVSLVTVPGLKFYETKTRELHELNPQAYNPNEQTPAEFEALKGSIREHGFLDPLVVRANGDIIAGHHRYRAIKEICVEDGLPSPKIPCIETDVDDTTARKLNIKLNHIKGSPNARLLGELLVDLFPLEERALPSFADDMAVLGLQESEAVSYINLIEPPVSMPSAGEEVRSFGKSVTLTLEFTNVKQRDEIKKIIQHRVEMEKKKSGDIVAEILAPKTPKKKKP